MRNMYANRVARGDGTTFSRGKERRSAITTYLGFKESCDYCHKPGHKKIKSFNFCASLAGENYL